ncbi:SGNH/GDSL hydrolase family protein [Streptomyces geranii]|uniref:SGNH/GDSL hydrolase family protein n=1 Tax=Streptomyces geranii TaxID=2058923 RepID=UPI001E3B8779|nr:SGNH/GDSL hydrolase family protein [Streptomyces geranii]
MKTPTMAGIATLAAGGVFLAAMALGNDDDNDNTPVAATHQKAPATNSPTPTATSPANGQYVALGDSYTSGPNIPSRSDSAPAGCDRSDHNYPSLVAERLHLSGADFHDMSCDGATIADLTTPQSTEDGVNRAQLSALSTRTSLVTLGIGGNDIGFSSLIKQCVKAGVLYYATGSGKYTGVTAPCREEYNSGATDEIQLRIDKAGSRLATALTEVRRRAPQAEVYVVGYPAILPPTAGDCGRDMGLAPADVPFLHKEAQSLNSTLRERASAAGAVYVDTYKPSVGHDACSDRTTRWIEPMIPLAPAAPVHPNARGERGMANAVLDAIDTPK